MNESFADRPDLNDLLGMSVKFEKDNKSYIIKNIFWIVDEVINIYNFNKVKFVGWYVNDPNLEDKEFYYYLTDCRYSLDYNSYFGYDSSGNLIYFNLI